MRSVAACLGLTATILVSLACGTSSSTVNVYAASSLTDLLRELRAAFEQEHPGSNLQFSFAGSTALATQIRQGAPADIYASASPLLTGSLAAQGYVQKSQLIASTRMVVVVQADDATIGSLARLADADVILVLADEGVPAGDYARDVLAKASTPDGLGTDFQERVLANVRSFELDVRGALLKVELGEADAAIVYETDVRPGNANVRTVAIPDHYNVVATYSVALLTEANDSASEFYDFLASQRAAEVIRELGFAPLRTAD